MHTIVFGRAVGAALFTLLLAGLPGAARATPGPVDARPGPARAAVVPRELPGRAPDFGRVFMLPLEAAWLAPTRGALAPRAGLGYQAARERGPGPALQAASIDVAPQGEVDVVTADEVPLDTVTRGAVVPLQGGEPGAWDGEGVGPTAR